MLILDSTPLIYLAKIGIIENLKEIWPDIIIPSTVYKEVVEKGIIKGETDALIIKRLVENGDFQIRDVKMGRIHKRLGDLESLSRADLDVIQYAETTNGIAVMDESIGRSICRIQGVRCHGTIYILLTLIKEEIIKNDEGKELINRMIKAGWFCSTDLYSSILEKLDKI